MTKRKRDPNTNKYDDIVERALDPGGNGIISLSYNSIGDEGVAALADALTQSPHMGNLRALLLEGNSIGAEGAAALAHVLAKSPHLGGLTKLYLHNNGIGDEGAVALAAALANSPHLGSLTGIYLSFNSIGDEGAAALARALTKPHMDELRVLNLHWNLIGTEGAAAFYDALTNSPHLTKLNELYLCSNKVNKEMRKRIRGAWQRGGDRRQRMAALFGAVEALRAIRNIPALDYRAFTLVAPYL